MKFFIKYSYAIYFPIFRIPYTNSNGKLIVFDSEKVGKKYMKDNALFNSFLGYYSKLCPLTDKDISKHKKHYNKYYKNDNKAGGEFVDHATGEGVSK